MVFNTPKAGPLNCVTSPMQKEKIYIVILSILNDLATINTKTQVKSNDGR